MTRNNEKKLKLYYEVIKKCLLMRNNEKKLKQIPPYNTVLEEVR